MAKIQDREQNLFNAMDTLAQFYDEIETFLSILMSQMERSGYTSKAERLRPGTFTTKNLTRRLLATATIVYAKAQGAAEEFLEDDEAEEEELEVAKSGKEEILITPDLRIPFVHISLYAPRVIPSVSNLTSPAIQYGAVGQLSFLERRTNEPASPNSPSLSLSNLANIRFQSAKKINDQVSVPCYRPKRMKKYKLVGQLVGFENQRLLDIDSQEKIRQISKAIVAASEQ